MTATTSLEFSKGMSIVVIVSTAILCLLLFISAVVSAEQAKDLKVCFTSIANFDAQCSIWASCTSTCEIDFEIPNEAFVITMSFVTAILMAVATILMCWKSCECCGATYTDKYAGGATPAV